MIEDIKNIYCVGRNFPAHAFELGNSIPIEPIIFSKPTHALVLLEGQSVLLPEGMGEIHHEAELVVRIAQTYYEELNIDELIDSLALGIDFTLRDVQKEMKNKGLPWLKAKGFKNSAALTEFWSNPGATMLNATDFSLCKNKQEVQRGNTGNMIFNLKTILDYCGKLYGLGKGDIIFTGTPSGVGSVADKDLLQLFWGDKMVGECIVRIGNH